jgi:tRNA(Ile)-lysidine synthase
VPFSSKWLVSHLEELLPGFPQVRILLAFSGGADSTALLTALSAARPAGLRLRAVHVNHGLHANAPKWSAHCLSLAKRLAVPLNVVATQVDGSGGASLEAAARDARYAVLSELLEPGEFLLTAHHEDDQLETVLLQLFRGAGVAGLSAMPELARFAAGWHARPLLSRSRAELIQWLQEAAVDWIDDDTNNDESLDRNYLRRLVLPLIRQRWPGVAPAVARSARHAAEAQRLLDAIARSDVSRAACGPDLFVSVLRSLPLERRRNALRFWIAKAGARLPDTSRLEELAGPVMDARLDANPRVVWGDVEVQRHADLLSLALRRDVSVARQRGEGDSDGVRAAGARANAPAGLRSAHAGRTSARRASRGPAGAMGAVVASPIEWQWRDAPVLDLFDFGGGRLELKADQHGPIDLEALPVSLTVRRRIGGERLRPRRGGPRRSLKRLLQESRVPIRERERLPLLFSGSTLIAVASLWVDESVQATAETVHRGRLLFV